MPFWMGDDAGGSLFLSRRLTISSGSRTRRSFWGPSAGCRASHSREPTSRREATRRRALDVSDAAGDENGRSDALHLLGVGPTIAGDLPEAREWMTQRLSLVRSQGNDFLIASEAGNLSMVERQLGDLDAAEALARESLVTSERSGDRFTPPFIFSGLAAIALERKDHERAATLIGAAESHMEATGMAWPPDERPHYERTLAELQGAMTSDAFARSRSTGAAMSSNAAIDYALEGRAVETDVGAT